MNSSTILGIVITLIMILPLYWLLSAGSKKRKKLSKKLTELASNKSCSLSQQDLWDRTTIGIDESKKMLFYVSQTNHGLITHSIDVSTIKSCRINTIDKDAVAANGKPTKVTDRLELVISFTEAGQNEVSLEFYNTANGSYGLSGELQLIEKWAHIANEMAKKK